MKVIKFMLACIIVLLVLGIYYVQNNPKIIDKNNEEILSDVEDSIINPIEYTTNITQNDKDDIQEIDIDDIDIISDDDDEIERVPCKECDYYTPLIDKDIIGPNIKCWACDDTGLAYVDRLKRFGKWEKYTNIKIQKERNTPDENMHIKCDLCNGSGKVLKSYVCPLEFYDHKCEDVYCQTCLITHCRNNMRHEDCPSCGGKGRR